MKLKLFLSTFLLGALMLLSSIDSNAQCAMCKRVAESNMEDNQNNVGKNLNKGILYLLSVPYLLGAIGIFVWYSERKKRKSLLNNKETESNTTNNE